MSLGPTRRRGRFFEHFHHAERGASLVVEVTGVLLAYTVSDKPDLERNNAELRAGTQALSHESGRRDRVESHLDLQLSEQHRRGAPSEDLFRLLVSSVIDYAIFVLDPGGFVKSWNEGAQRLKGYAVDEILGKHFSTFYEPAQVAAGRCERALQTAAKHGHYEDEGWRLTKDGTRFWANVVITALRDESGNLLGFGKVTRDLSDRKQGEDDRERFRLFIESVQDYAMFILDPSGHVATWNHGAERIKGYSADEIIGRHFSTFYPKHDVDSGKCDHELEVATRAGRFEDEGWRLRKDGTRFWANVIITAMHDTAGTLVGFSKVTRDLTERKQNEEERAARLAAEQANRAKDEFLAMLGHELRNPLAPIVTALELLKLRGDAHRSSEYQVIQRQVQHMVHLVDDLLDVSRVASGKIELSKSRLDLRDIITRSVEVASPMFERKRHHLALNMVGEALWTDADEARLLQVFSNLLTNAAKFTSTEGHIAVTLWKEPESVVAKVEDDGIGIDAELLPNIFEAFAQGHQSADRRSGGLGLGLALVKSLVGLHGGSVDARSEGPGKGSQFTVRLPVSQASEVATSVSEDAPSLLSPVAHPQQILVVDDNEDACALLTNLLSEQGHEVRAAADGPQALSLIAEFSPSVAILDIGLPAMDGYELAGLLRSALPSLRLAALTGYGMQTSHERSRKAGFERHFVKPVDIQALLEFISDTTDSE